MEDTRRKGKRKILADTANRIRFKAISSHVSRNVLQKNVSFNWHVERAYSVLRN